MPASRSSAPSATVVTANRRQPASTRARETRGAPCPYASALTTAINSRASARRLASAKLARIARRSIVALVGHPLLSKPPARSATPRWGCAPPREVADFPGQERNPRMGSRDAASESAGFANASRRIGSITHRTRRANRSLGLTPSAPSSSFRSDEADGYCARTTTPHRLSICSSTATLVAFLRTARWRS